MRIAIDARFYGTEHSGLGRYTINFLRALQEVDKENTYLLLLREPYATHLKWSKNFHAVKADIPHYSFAEQLLLPPLVQKQRADLYHALHLNVPVLLRTPFLVTIHDLIKTHFTSSDTTTRPGPIFWIKRKGYAIAMHHALQKSQAIIVPSNFVKEDIMVHLPDINPAKIHPFYEAPDAVFTRKLRRSEKEKIIQKLRLGQTSYILYVGNAWPHKNLEALIAAWQRLDEPSLKLVIVSKKNHFYKKLEEKLPQGVKKNIRQFERVTDKQLYALYAHARATVTPSLMEGFGLVGIESLTVGTPVAASNIPVFKEVYGESANYARVKSPGALADAIKKAMHQTTIPKLPREYSWTRLAKQVKNLYHKVEGAR